MISIITPTYNSASDIAACLQSVAEQAYPYKEHLIIDNDSTDGTRDIVRSFAERYPHIRLHFGKDSGIYDAMNKGLAAAGGEWLYFLGSDDTMYDSAVLADVARHFDGQTDIVYGDVLLKGIGKRYGGAFSKERLRTMNICQQSVLYRRSVFDAVGIFNTKYRIAADWDLHIRCFGNPSLRTKHIDRIIATYALTGYSTGKVDLRLLFDRLMRGDAIRPSADNGIKKPS